MTRRTVYWVLLVLLAATGAFAQHATTGSIAGDVADDTGAPVSDATVTITSAQGTRVVSTDDDGRFLAPYLTPGLYSVEVDRTGFQSIHRHEVEVRLGQRVDLQFALTTGTFTDTIDVTGASPVIDFSTVSTGMGVTSSFLRRVPAGRRLSETLYLVPGVSSGGNVGRENPSISGASGLENQYVVDGVNITDPRYGALGVYSSTYGSLGNGVTYDFIDEVQVRTAGAEAEFDQSTGGMVNVITKSGTNEIHGSVFSYLSPEGLEGDRELITLDNGAVNTTGEPQGELGFTLGGPISRDQIFYFVAANYQRRTTTYLAPEGFPLYDLGETDQVRNVLSYAAKVSFAPSNNHRLELSFFGDPARSDNGPQSPDAMRFRDTGAFSELEYGGHNQSLSYQGVLSQSWLVEASFARADSDYGETPSVDRWLVNDETVEPTEVYGGIGRYESEATGENLQLRVKGTNFLGRHEVRYGVSYEDVHYDRVREYTGPTVPLSNGMRTSSGVELDVLPDPTYGQIYRVARANLVDESVSTALYTGLFAQDRITVSDRLTVSAGLRYEIHTLKGSGNSFTFDDNWGPRLGIVYDPTGRGKAKLFGNYGVYFAKIPNNFALTLFRGGTAIRGRVLRADYFDPDLTDPVPEGVEALGTTQHLLLSGSTPSVVDPNAKSTYIQELSLGGEYEVLPELSLGLRYLYRDMPRVVEDIGTGAMVLYFTGELESVDYFITNPRDGFPPTANDVGAFQDPIHEYQSIELTARKRFSKNWTVLASYRWSDLEGTYEGFYRNDTERSSPAMSGMFDFPTNDPSYTEIGGPVFGFGGDIRYLGQPGPLPNDRTHQLKLHGSYRFDFGLTVGGGAFVSTGRPLTPMAANPVYRRAGDIPEAPRGSGIETEDGFKTRTPTVSSLDLHLDYEVPVNGSAFVFALDVFNLLNSQEVVDYDQNTERRPSVQNQDFGRIILYQSPRQIRLAVRFEF